MFSNNDEKPSIHTSPVVSIREAVNTYLTSCSHSRSSQCIPRQSFPFEKQSIHTSPVVSIREAVSAYLTSCFISRNSQYISRQSFQFEKQSIHTSPVVSIREAVFTVSPNRQYRGILIPTTPATALPVYIPE